MRIWIGSAARIAIMTSLLALATPARADAITTQTWFNALTIDQRTDLQGSLILLGQYGGMVDGQFGANTYGALTAWQQSIDAAVTGVLTEPQQDLLGQMASQVMSELGMALEEDHGGHLSIMLPMGLLTEKRDRVNGTLYQDSAGDISVETFWRTSYEGTLAQHYAEASTPGATKTVTYSVLRADRYVVTGVEAGRYFYEFVHADGDANAGFRFVYTAPFRQIGGVASVFAASYSAPFNVIEASRDGISPNTSNPPAAAPTGAPEIQTPKIAKPSSKSPSTSEEGVHEFGQFITLDSAPGVIAMVGEIGPSTPLDFRRALRSMPAPTTLMLASEGGLVSSALLLAYQVHELGLFTYVAPDTGCYSACSFVFFAGNGRLAEGELGVHQVWGDQADASSAQTVVSDILEAFTDFGVRQEVTSAMLRTPPEDMYIFSATELTSWGLNSQADD